MPPPVVVIPTRVPLMDSSVDTTLGSDASDSILYKLRTVNNCLKDIDILAPCSRPPSPDSQHRVDEMSAVISHAVQSFPQSVPHFLDLASTRILGPHPDHPSMWGTTDRIGPHHHQISPLPIDESQWDLWASAIETPPAPMSAREAQKQLYDIFGPPSLIRSHVRASDSTAAPRSKGNHVEQSIAGPSNHANKLIMSNHVPESTIPQRHTVSSPDVSNLSIGFPSQPAESPPDFDLYDDGTLNPKPTSMPHREKSTQSGLDVTLQVPPLHLGLRHQNSGPEDKYDEVTTLVPSISAEEHQKHMDDLRSVPMIDLASPSGKKRIERGQGSRNIPVTPPRYTTKKATLLQTPPNSNSQISSLPQSQTSKPLTPSGSAGPRNGLFGGLLFSSQYDVDSTVDDISQFISDDLA